MAVSEQARAAARDVLRIVPLVMRTVAAELRSNGELPAPAHFGLLSVLAAQPHPRTLTELASTQGVSLPTMSNSISALVGRGWVRRSAGSDRRQIRIEVTPRGRATVQRVGRSAERHLAELLEPIGSDAQHALRDGLAVLFRAFAGATARPKAVPRHRPVAARRRQPGSAAQPTELAARP